MTTLPACSDIYCVSVIDRPSPEELGFGHEQSWMQLWTRRRMLLPEGLRLRVQRLSRRLP